MYANDVLVVSTGLGIELPTGDDVQARVGGNFYTVENDAVHLHPYLAALADDGRKWFYNGFVQLDVPLAGNDLRTTGIPGTAGTLNDQVLLHINAGAGYWLYRSPRRTCMTGLAGLLELHFTQTLDSTDSVVFSDPLPLTAGERSLALSNRRNHYTLLNVTAGLHVELTPDTLLAGRCGRAADVRGQPLLRFRTAGAIDAPLLTAPGPPALVLAPFALWSGVRAALRLCMVRSVATR